MKINDIEVYDAIIEDDGDGVRAISLVESPAIQKDFLYFNEDKELIKFKIENEDERIIVSPVMITDLPIIRINNGIEYFIKYPELTIKYMVQKFMKENKNNLININHNDLFPDGLFIYESYLTDDNKKAPKEFGDIPNGSWFVTIKVDNDEVWNQVKKGEFKGLSLEGFFAITKVPSNNDEVNRELELINKLYKDLCKIK